MGNGARIAKLLRTDRSRAMVVAFDAVWGWGLADAIGQWRRGDRPLAKAALYRLWGTMVGFCRGLGTRVVDGHYAVRTGDR
jgi:hypothetical protein